MLDQQQRDEIRARVWFACDAIRSIGVPADIKDLALCMLVLKYLSDTSSRTGGGFAIVVPEGSRFYDLFAARAQPGNGQRIDVALAAIEEINSPLLRHLFDGISFDATAIGSIEQRDRIHRQLLEAFHASGLCFGADNRDVTDAVAFACDCLVARLADISGRQGGEFITPPEVAQLIARLVQPSDGEAVGDPCCGSGSLLIACSQYARQRSGGSGCILYGQEKNGSTWALAKMNMVLHGEMQAQLEWGDTLRDPKLLTPDRQLRKFEVVVSSPPFSVRDWGYELAENDVHARYRRGLPPRTTGDYAFISHMVETLMPEKGRMAVVVSLGVLFRGAAERQIRERLLSENLIDAVIALPPKMFSHTGIQVAILILRMGRADDGVLFIDASRSYQQGKLRNLLRDSDIETIEEAYQLRRDTVRSSRVVARKEIAANDFDLSVSRYVEATEEEPELDLTALRMQRGEILAELASLEKKLAILLKGIDVG